MYWMLLGLLPAFGMIGLALLAQPPRV